MKVFVQIGTNDGHDKFHHMVALSKPDKVILVEPNAALRETIRANYTGMSNVFIESVAITKEDKGMVKLVIPKIKEGVAANGANYDTAHFSLLPMDDWGDEFTEIEAPSMTFEALCRKHNITKIYYLQIDTEGYDTEIIKSIPFNKIHIDIIKYEKWGFTSDCYTRYGEEAKQYGLSGVLQSRILLTSLGYTLFEEKKDIIAAYKRNDKLLRL